MGSVVAGIAASAGCAGANAASPNSSPALLENDGTGMKLDDCTNIIETTIIADSGTMPTVFLAMVSVLTRAAHRQFVLLSCIDRTTRYCCPWLGTSCTFFVYGVCMFALLGFHNKYACGECLVRTANLSSALGASIYFIHGRHSLGLPDTGSSLARMR